VFKLKTKQIKYGEDNKMTLNETKMQSEATAGKITDLEQAALALYAELGQKMLELLPEDSEYAPLADKIRELNAQLEGLRRELSDLEQDYKTQLTALTCFSCKMVNPEGARFCEGCGAKLGEPPKEYCRACNTINTPGQKFCGECGAKLEI